MWRLVRLVWKPMWWAFLLACYWFGFTSFEPKGVGWTASAEAWLAMHIAHPILVALVTGLTAGTVVIPEAWRIIKSRLEIVESPERRPKLRVRNFVVQRIGFADTYFAANSFISGHYLVANVGNAPAYITETHCEVFWTTQPLPMKRPYEGKNPSDPISFTITAGSSRSRGFQSEDTIPPNVAYDLINNETHNLYVLGWISYRGYYSKVRHRTAFCRKYDFNRKRFYPVEDTDYEHEE